MLLLWEEINIKRDIPAELGPPPPPCKLLFETVIKLFVVIVAILDVIH